MSYWHELTQPLIVESPWLLAARPVDLVGALFSTRRLRAASSTESCRHPCGRRINIFVLVYVEANDISTVMYTFIVMAKLSDID